ncbi:hypothetical protein [Gloeocapsa sp. PCC 73106]|uniref:hypothetical protein n=1 Tax=Gloeocapsa sp. PCC 73106 TaxID=102232 RepID=UPI0002AC18A3|nr:hypothetical protein [Gloeocapsa sp. PCC 73106]ELR99096.1 hypothetical protein GLO73106DRAFT_00029420 [Gloeocapsa sp. PCC 73106]
MVYSTQELISILECELRATWQGKRVLMSPAARIDNPVISKAINLEKASKVFAYQDFRSQIHQYQRENQVSGIVWRICRFREESIPVPELHNQLILVPGDKEILVNAKASIIDFWYQLTRNMNYFKVADRSSTSEVNPEITLESMTELINKAEWAEVDSGCNELYLGLCWGNPEESQYLWARPQSGCDRLIAAPDQPSGLNIY